jgi:hypothetical protein
MAMALVFASVVVAAAPRYILVSGPGLAQPVLLPKWEENGALLSALVDARIAPPKVVRQLTDRPRLRLSLFWGWPERPRPKWPSQANQSGWFYPTWRSQPPVVDLLVNGTRVPRAAPARVLRILARRGVPTRLPAELTRSRGAADPWTKLRRPLHLPRLAPGAECPISGIDRRVNWDRANIFGGSGTGRGPVYPGLGAYGGRLNAPRDTQFGGPWAGQKVFWYVLPSYRGPVLVRGRRLDGPQWLGFNGTLVPDRELQIEPYETVSWQGQPPGSRGVPSAVRARASGCYVVQMDGTTFSRIVTFTVSVP